jgi:hypothetical protein
MTPTAAATRMEHERCGSDDLRSEEEQVIAFEELGHSVEAQGNWGIPPVAPRLPRLSR